MSNIRIRGGKFNYIKGDYTVVDHSRHVTNIDSDNIYRTTVANSYNNNFKKIGACSARDNYEDNEMPSTTTDDQRREDYTEPPPSQPHWQSQFMPHPGQFPAASHIINRDSFNIKNIQMDDVFNDYSQTHYSGYAPPTNERVRPQNKTPRLPQFMENSVLPYSVQHIEQRFRQTFSESDSTRSLPEGNVIQIMLRNSDDEDEDNDPNKRRPPVLTSSPSGPTYRTIEGNFTKYDNSKHETNISSSNTKDNIVINSFNDNSSIDPRKLGTGKRVQK